MRRYRLLDLCCKAGGCSKGYYLAGFDVHGVDIEPQSNYPYSFTQGDMFGYLATHGSEFDAIHVSPPCQGYSTMNKIHRKEYPLLIKDVRRLLEQTGKPYVIENVGGARKEMLNPIMLCGSMFGLKVYRHRYFESNIMLFEPAHSPHGDKTPSAGHGLSPKGFISVVGNGGAKGLGMPYMEYASMAMGIDWMSRAEISQAIPPAYTEYIGRQLIRHLEQSEAAPELAV